MSSQTYSKPSQVIADKGRVLVDGPDHVDIALTPKAAEETARRLEREAEKASKNVPSDEGS